jgi:hypothetical protein
MWPTDTLRLGSRSHCRATSALYLTANLLYLVIQTDQAAEAEAAHSIDGWMTGGRAKSFFQLALNAPDLPCCLPPPLPPPPAKMLRDAVAAVAIKVRHTELKGSGIPPASHEPRTINTLAILWPTYSY